jgi:hypothetical protein
MSGCAETRRESARDRRQTPLRQLAWSNEESLRSRSRAPKTARLNWYAGRGAIRVRGDIPGRAETFAHHVEADLCLLTAITAADLTANVRIHNTTLSRDPLTTADQLREIASGYDRTATIEAEHETARQAYIGHNHSGWLDAAAGPAAAILVVTQ